MDFLGLYVYVFFFLHTKKYLSVDVLPVIKMAASCMTGFGLGIIY